MVRKSLGKAHKARRRTGKVRRRMGKARRRTGKARRRTGRIRRRSRKNRHGGQGMLSRLHNLKHQAKRQLGEWQQGKQLVPGSPYSLSVGVQQARAAEAAERYPIDSEFRGPNATGYIHN